MSSNTAGFIVLTCVQIPAVCLVVYILLRLPQQTSSLRRLPNHALLYLLCVATWTILIELPHTQKYLLTGSVTIHQVWFCFLWNISFFSMATLNRFLMTFMAIERHFLIFRPQLYRTARSRFILHFLPLNLISFSVIAYTSITHIFTACTKPPFNYSSFLCGYTCGILNDELGTTYAWLLVFIPTIITSIACILLPIRFIVQRQHLHRLQWFRARKMIIQMSIIAGTYTICWLPYTIILQLLLNEIFTFSNAILTRFLIYTPYVTSLLMPIIVFHTVPERINCGRLRIKCKIVFNQQRLVMTNPKMDVMINQ
jgi:hypothetical protein